MKRLVSLLFVLCILLSLFTACGGSAAPTGESEGAPSLSAPDEPVSASPESAPESAPATPESAPAGEAGDDGRIPLEDRVYIRSFSDPLPEENSQLACKDDTARRLARAVDPLIWLTATAEPPYFDSDHPLDTDTAARIAFDNTRRIDFGGLSFTPEGFSSGGYPDHPITKRIARLWEEEHAIICDVIYADDAAANLERLFGISGWEHRTVADYNYFPEEGIYVTYGDLLRGIQAPQVLSWEETDNGYSCEVILIDDRFGTIGGVEVTEENIAQLAGTVPHYIYTFDMSTGEPVVTSFQKKS